MFRKKLDITAHDIEVRSTPADFDNWPSMYGVDRGALIIAAKNGSKFKIVSVKCDCYNQSLIRKFEDVRAYYSGARQLPDIILGTHPDTGPWVITLKPHTHRMIYITMLINQGSYGNEEVIGKLRDVPVFMGNENSSILSVVSNEISMERCEINILK